MKTLLEWLKTFLLFSMTTFLINPVYAVNIDDGNIITCSGNFYDTGGVSNNYTNFEDHSITITSSNAQSLVVDFDAGVFNIESHGTCSYDYINVYDGTDDTGIFLGKYCGTTSPGSFTSTNPDNALYFEFHSDFSVVRSGWEASISCPIDPCDPVASGNPDTDGDDVSDVCDFDDDNDGILDTRENVADQNDTYIGYTGGSTHVNSYTYADATTVTIDFHPIDNSFNVDIEGVTLLQNGKYLDLQVNSDALGTKLLFADDNGSMTTPWVAHTTTGVPRVRVIIDETGLVSIYGTRTTAASSVLELMHTQNGDLFNTLYFEAGSRTITVTNPNGPGPDAISGTTTVSPNRDFDEDGLTNDVDLDSDNDGIPDNIEAQPTLGTIAPNGDAGPGNNGLDTAYTGGLIPVNTYPTSSTDYLNNDTDGDGATDCEEGNINPSTTKSCPVDNGNVGTNGMVDWAESSNDYIDVNGTVDTVFDDLSNVGGGTTEVDYRDENTIVPITISYAYPELYGGTLEVTFGTATEAGNIGFNIYAIKSKKKWIKLNEEIIPSKIRDSFEPQEYEVSIEIAEGVNFKKIGIAGVDLSGNEDRHGPFKIGKQTGEKTISKAVDWEKVRAEVKQKRQEKEAKRQAKKAAKRETKELLKEDIVTFNVTQKAVYRVTHDDLLVEGINLKGFKASTIALSFKGEGVARHISELSKKGKWTKKSAIVFVGEGPNVEDALYVKENHYRLSLGKDLVVESEEIEALTSTEVVIDHNKIYGYTILLDDPFYETHLFTANENGIATYTGTFDMPLVPQSGTSTLTLKAAVMTEGSHHMNVMVNQESIIDAQKEGISAWKIETQIDNDTLKESDNEITLTLYGEDDGFDYAVYDKLIINYDDGEEKESLTPTIVLNDNVLKKDLKVKRGTNYLIISHPLFINETLDRYVETRESEGWKIKVVNVEDIYTAYTNGMAIPEGIQSYLEDATQRGVTHVQLVGSASYDYHNYLGQGSMSFIPSIYTLTNKYVQYTPCDTCYVIGEDGLPKVAIGRWPVRTLDGFENVVNKTLNWKSSGHSSNRSALLIADETDRSGTKFDIQMEDMAEKIEANGYTTQKVYLDDLNEEHGDEAVTIARGQIQEAMVQGVSVLSYNGHGSTTHWSERKLLKEEDLATIDNTMLTPVILPYTCMATYADSPRISTLAHQLIAAGENGAVAVYGASTFSNYGDNGVMAGEVFEGLNRGETLGEAILNKKLELGSGYNDVIMNGSLIGDVSLQIGE